MPKEFEPQVALAGNEPRPHVSKHIYLLTPDISRKVVWEVCRLQHQNKLPQALSHQSLLPFTRLSLKLVLIYGECMEYLFSIYKLNYFTPSCYRDVGKDNQRDQCLQSIWEALNESHFINLSSLIFFSFLYMSTLISLFLY